MAIIRIWIAVLKKDRFFEPFSHQDNFRAVYEMDRAYWCGHLYELLGEEGKAIEEFQRVWLNGQWSLRAKEAKKYLEERNIPLKTPEKYKSKAFRNYVSYMIHSWGGLCVITLLLLFVSQLSKL